MFTLYCGLLSNSIMSKEKKWTYLNLKTLYYQKYWYVGKMVPIDLVNASCNKPSMCKKKYSICKAQ